jgi:hypothetical protein
MNRFDRHGWYVYAFLAACVAAPVSLFAWAIGVFQTLD